MSFAWPQLLWLLLLPVAWLVWELTRGRRVAAATAHPKILRAEVGTHDLSLVREPNGPRAYRLRPWLMLGLTCAILALARPQWGRIEEPVFDQSREILLAVDLSRSMLAPDVKPSRLERTKLLIQALLEKLKGERVGLVVFSGTAFLQSPLSSDYEILREFLPALRPEFLPEGGTNYRALIDTSLDAFGGSGAADRFLIILSDGEATDDDWQAQVPELKKKGVRVLGLGVGTATGTMIPDGSGGFVKDARGAVVLSKLESSTLQNLANATGGVYRDASTWIDLAGLIDETVNLGRKGDFTEKSTVRLVDRFQWPLALALWCFLVSFYYEFPVRPRPRDVALRGATGPGEARPRNVEPDRAGPAATTPPHLLMSRSSRPRTLSGRAAQRGARDWLAGAACTLALLSAIPAPAAVTVAPPPATAQPAPAAGSPLESAKALGKIVGRISAKDALTAPDISELAHETLTWGRRIRDAHLPVPPGPVYDALKGLDELEARGNKLADWSQLRKDLEELLERPPEPPPQKQQQQKDQQQNQSQQQQEQGGQKQDQPPQSQQQPQNQSSQDQSQEQQQQQQNQSSPADQKPPEPKSGQSAFGDMSKPPPPQPSPPPPGETQKVGGAPEKNPPQETDPSLTLPMEKLDQLKNQDSPAQLFQMMQADRSQASRKKPQKDW